MITILKFLDKYNYENISRVTVLILSTLFDNAIILIPNDENIFMVLRLLSAYYFRTLKFT